MYYGPGVKNKEQELRKDVESRGYRFDNLGVFIVSIAFFFSSTYTARIIIRVHFSQRMATGFKTSGGTPDRDRRKVGRTTFSRSGSFIRVFNPKNPSGAFENPPKQSPHN